jgi:hypothetical protein
VRATSGDPTSEVMQIEQRKSANVVQSHDACSRGIVTGRWGARVTLQVLEREGQRRARDANQPRMMLTTNVTEADAEIVHREELTARPAHT